MAAQPTVHYAPAGGGGTQTVPWTANRPVRPEPVVVVGVDGSTRNVPAVAWAAAEAAEQGLDLVLAYVADGSGDDASSGAALEAAARATLERAARQVRRDHPGLRVRSQVRRGRPGQALLEDSPTLLVVGRRGAGGFARLPLGSTSLWAAGTSTGPVVVIPSEAAAGSGESFGDEVTDGGVLVAVDPMAPETAVLDFAFERARQHAVPLRVLAAWEASPVLAHGRSGIRQAWQRQEDRVQSALEDLLRPWVAAYPDVAVTPLVVHGHPAGTVLEHQTGRELTVLGRGGSRRVEGFRMGPITRSVLHLGAGPVAVVP